MLNPARATVLDGATCAAFCAAPLFSHGSLYFLNRLSAGVVGVLNAAIRYASKPSAAVHTRDLCIVQVLLKESVIGSDVLCCSSCQRHTRKCTSCRDGYTWGNGILSSLQCAVCVGSIRSWSNLESPAVSQVSAICSWCLQKSVHHLVEKNTLRRSVCVSRLLFQVYFALIPVAGTAAPCVTAAPSNVRSARTIWPAAGAITTTNCAYNANHFLLSPHRSSLERACFPRRK